MKKNKCPQCEKPVYFKERFIKYENNNAFRNIVIKVESEELCYECVNDLVDEIARPVYGTGCEYKDTRDGTN